MVKDLLSHKRAFVIAIIYCALGLVWIYFSDFLAGEVSVSRVELLNIQTYKGFFYILLTSVILYMMVLYFLYAQSREYKTNIKILEEKLRLEEDLKEVNFMYQSLVDNMLDSVAHCRMMYKDGRPIDYQFLSVNKIFESMTGLHGAVGRTINELIPGYSLQNPESISVFDSVASSGKPMKWEHYLKALNQSYSFSIYSPRQGEFIVVASDVTLERKTQGELEHNYALLNAIVNGSPDAIFAKDIYGRYTLFNSSAGKFIGVDSKDAIGKDDFALFSKESAKIIYDTDRTIMASGHVQNHQEEVLSKDGNRYIFQVTKGPLFDSNGNLTGMFGISRDITKSKLSEIELLKNDTVYKNIAEGVYAVDTQNRCTYINQTALQMLNIVEEDIIGKVPHNVFHYHDINGEEYLSNNCPIIGAMTHGEAVRLEEMFMRKDNKAFPVAVTVSPIYQNDISIGSVVVFSDITRQKQIEQNLLESENHLRAIIEMEPECVKMIDEKGCLLYVNPAGLEMIEAELEEVQGREVLSIITPEYQDAFVDMHRRVIAGERVHLVFETVGLKGRHCWMETISVPMQTEDGVVLLGVTRDITERKKLEENLKATNEHLQELVAHEIEKRLEKEKMLIQQSKMAMMGEMIGAIAHQWRQPLNSLGLSIQDIYLSYKLDEINSEYVEEFKNSSMTTIQRMSKTIDDFRNFFKPDKEKEEFILEHIVNDTLNIMLSQLTNHFIKVNFTKPSESRLYGYKSELEQAILMVISNAYDALIDNNIQNPEINILVQADSIANKAILIIEDNGGGVPIEIMGRIFEPYFTTKEQGHGTGIGLYMAKEIIERQMGGKIYCENTGIGARFVMEFFIEV